MKCSEKVPSGIISGISNLWNCGDAREQHEKVISFPFVQSKCKSELSWQFICILMHIVFHSRDHFRFSKLSWVGGLRERGHFCHTSTNILRYFTKKTESRQSFYLPYLYFNLPTGPLRRCRGLKATVDQTEGNASCHWRTNMMKLRKGKSAHQSN